MQQVEHPEGRGSRTALTDGLLAACAGVTALAVYLATLYPGLLAVGDATKFSFVGKVLGTPHAPGYPLYVMVSHLFSYVPWGTLAYRMNAFSALLASVAVALGFLIGRSLGASRPAALASSLALAFGDAFWSRALYAKAYTLHAALVSAGVLSLLRWDRLRDLRWLYGAAAVFALCLGNHLTIIAVLPAVVLFTLFTDPRTSCRPRTIVVVLALVAIGLSQYLFILVRTLQHAPYLEARAENLSQLWAVMTARRFAHEVGAYSWHDLLTTRIPAIWQLVTVEVRWVGALFLVPGAIVFAVRQGRRAFLFLAGALGVLALTAAMSSEEDQGFLLAAFVLLWPSAALGVDLAVGLVRRVARPAAAVAALVLAAAVPATQVVRNYTANDHHRETFDTRYFDTLFRVLPPKAAILADEYRWNMMVLYKLLGEARRDGRDIRMIPADGANVKGFYAKGYEVFAFESSREKMRDYGALFTLFTDLAPRDNEILRRRPVYRLVSTPRCREAGDGGWLDVSPVLEPEGRLSIRVDNVRPFDARIVIYAGGTAPLTPALVAGSGRYLAPPIMSVTGFDQARPSRRRLAESIAADRADVPASVLDAPYVTRAEVHLNDNGESAQFGLDFGPSARAAVGVAVVDRREPRRASFCSHPLSGHEAWPDGDAQASLLPALNVDLVDGWHAREARPDGSIFRWTTNRAVMVVPIARPRAARLVVQAEPFDYPGRGDGGVTLVLNGVRLGSRPAPAGVGRLEWAVPATSWRPGLNEIVLEVEGARRPSEVGQSPDTRLLGLAVASIELVAAEPGR